MRLLLILALVCAPLLHAQSDPLVKPAPKPGQADIRDGEDAFEEGDMAEAIEHFSAAIEAQPKNDAIYAYRAAAYVALNKLKEAEFDLAEAMKLETTFCLAFNTRGYVRWLKRDLNGAIEDYTTALAYAADDRRVDDGGRAQMHQNRGIAYQDAGNTDRALLDFNRCIELVPNYAAFYENRGLIYVDKQLFDIAFKSFDIALELDPKNARAYVNRAWAARLIGDYEQAVRDYSQALRLKADYGQALIGRGYAWLGWGRVEHAQRDFESALALPDHESSAALGLGEIEYSRGNWQAAQKHFAASRNADGRNSSAWYGEAMAQLKLGNREEAKWLADVVCVNEPGRAANWQLSADIAMADSDWQAGLTCMNRLIELTPDDLVARSQRARCYAKLGLFKVAWSECDLISWRDAWGSLVLTARIRLIEDADKWGGFAIKSLAKAKQKGVDLTSLADDQDFVSLKDNAEFKKLVEKQ